LKKYFQKPRCKDLNKTEGFALIELSLVIALMIMVTMLAVQGFSFYQRLILHAELDKLYTFFLATARKAAVDNQTYTIRFDAPQHSYTTRNAHNTTTYKLPEGVIFGLLPGIYGPPAQPKAAVRSPVTFEKQQTIFYADGRIQPGTVYITDAKKQWQYSLSVPVGTISYIRRYRYQHKKWELVA